MPQVYICTRCAEKIDGATQDWVIVSMDTSGSAGLETRAHADCEAKRLKQIQMTHAEPSRVYPTSSLDHTGRTLEKTDAGHS
jgi:hypothetical protein